MEGDRSPSRFLKSDWRKVCATDMLSPELNQLGWVVCGHFPAEIRSQMNIQRVNVLGAGISVLNMRSALDAVAEAVAQRRKGYICITGVHGVMEGQDEPTFLRILNNAFLCTPDGMPMVWMGKLRGHKEMSRVYGPDFMLAVCEWSQRSGCRHFFFGGADGVADALRESMTKRFPGLQVAGCYTPPFRPLNADEIKALQQQVSETKPDILWVGLSTPKQEKFMAEFLPKLDVTLMVGVGAAFDFHTGRVRQAPRWIQRSGLEWFYRMCCEPKRLAKRYLKNNPRFLWKVIFQILGIKKYPLNGE